MKSGTRAEFGLAARILREVQLQDSALDIEIHAMARRLEEIALILTEDGPAVLPPTMIPPGAVDVSSIQTEALAFSD